MKPQAVNTDCHLFPEMVDNAMGQFAAPDGDIRAAVAKAGCQMPPQGPAWPVEPGSLSESVYLFRQAIGLGNSVGPSEVAASLSNLGYAWRAHKRWADAEAAFRESLLLCQKFGDRSGEGNTYSDLGSLFMIQERWTDAEPALARALAIVQETGDCRARVNALGNLGVVYAALGQDEKASQHIHEAVAVANEIGDKALAERMLKRLSRVNRSHS